MGIATISVAAIVNSIMIMLANITTVKMIMADNNGTKIITVMEMTVVNNAYDKLNANNTGQ